MEHLAVIMDGNGRYAQKRGLPRADGHRAGAMAFVQAVKDFSTLPLKVLSVYAFSTENNGRKQSEVSNILSVIAYFLENEIYPICHELKISVRFIGNLSVLPNKLQHIISKAPNYGKRKTVVIAINYGGLDAIYRSVKTIIDSQKEITHQAIMDNLDTADLPLPDAVVRYGGYKRLSNFMPLETAYSELFFLDKMWPEYDINDLLDIMKKYDSIKRNFGGIND